MGSDGDSGKVRLRCSACGRAGLVPAWVLGIDKRIVCPACGERLTVGMAEGPGSGAGAKSSALVVRERDEAAMEEFAARVVGEVAPVNGRVVESRREAVLPPPVPAPLVPVEVAPRAGQLISCVDCGGPVSRFAPACPRCGRPGQVVAAAAVQAPPATTTVVVQQFAGGPVAAKSGCLASTGYICLATGLVGLVIVPPVGVVLLLVGLVLAVVGRTG